MDDIQVLIRAVNLELSPVFEERLRALLADKDREWLVDQVVRLSLDAHSLREIDRRSERDAKARARASRLERVRRLRLDAKGVADFVTAHASTTRDSLIDSGHLLAAAPPKGTVLLTAEHRSAEGEKLLEYAKDVLFALLFGDASTSTSLDRVQQELLTFALPVAKASALDFMRASTEITAAGTWQDPESVSNDERAANTLLEVQYGDTADELVGHGVIAALGLINNLEVNEQVFYARMIDVEQTTLIS